MSGWFSKKLNYIKIRLFKIISKVIEVLYRLDLLLKIKIRLIIKDKDLLSILYCYTKTSI